MIKEFYHYPQEFRFESGETLPSIDLCFHHSNNLDSQLPVIWICHALTANSNPEEWWDVLVGRGKLIDPEKFRIVCSNMLGSCYGSSGPSSKDVDGKEYLLRFPKVTVRDIVQSHELLRRHLKIDEIDLLIGGSIGGFQTLEWSIINPKVIKSQVLIACNAKVSPWGTAFNESQRMALFADKSFGEQSSIRGGESGLAAARSIALISYRSYEGYCQTQAEENDNFLFASRASSYQNYQGKKLVDRFDAYSYYNLTRSVDSHNVGRARGGVIEALSTVKAKTIVIGIDSDYLFPTHEQKFLADNIPAAIYCEISSDFGHDGFLLEWEQISNILIKNYSLFDKCKY